MTKIKSDMVELWMSYFLTHELNTRLRLMIVFCLKSNDKRSFLCFIFFYLSPIVFHTLLLGSFLTRTKHQWHSILKHLNKEISMKTFINIKNNIDKKRFEFQVKDFSENKCLMRETITWLKWQDINTICGCLFHVNFISFLD